MNTLSYESMFELYTQSSNGKQILGRTLLNVLGAQAASFSVLDVGAGDCVLTLELATGCAHVTAVEPRSFPAIEERVRGVANVSLVRSTVQNFHCMHNFNAAILSYVLDGQPSESAIEITECTERCLLPNGRLLIATFVEGCPWDKFTSDVSTHLGRTRQGGRKYVESLFLGSKYILIPKAVVSSRIHGKSIGELFENLSFFFKSCVEEYLDSRVFVCDLLRKYAVPVCESSSPNIRWSLVVKEVVLELSAQSAALER